MSRRWARLFLGTVQNTAEVGFSVLVWSKTVADRFLQSYTIVVLRYGWGDDPAFRNNFEVKTESRRYEGNMH